MPAENRPWLPAEFRALGIAWHGQGRGWQAALSREMKINPRTIRRWANGEVKIPARVQENLTHILLASDLYEGALCDEWVIGYAPQDDANIVREYILHIRAPRFIGRIVEVDVDGAPVESEGEANILSGLTCEISDYFVLCEIRWMDLPNTNQQNELVKAAATVAAEENTAADVH